jgi:hypothetical protein
VPHLDKHLWSFKDTNHHNFLSNHPFRQSAESATGWGSLQLMHHAKPMQISGGSIVSGSMRRPSLEGPSSIRIKLLRWIKVRLAKANAG